MKYIKLEAERRELADGTEKTEFGPILDLKASGNISTYFTVKPKKSIIFP